MFDLVNCLTEAINCSRHCSAIPCLATCSHHFINKSLGTQHRKRLFSSALITYLRLFYIIPLLHPLPTQPTTPHGFGVGGNPCGGWENRQTPHRQHPSSGSNLDLWCWGSSSTMLPFISLQQVMFCPFLLEFLIYKVATYGLTRSSFLASNLEQKLTQGIKAYLIKSWRGAAYKRVIWLAVVLAGKYLLILFYSPNTLNSSASSVGAIYNGQLIYCPAHPFRSGKKLNNLKLSQSWGDMQTP